MYNIVECLWFLLHRLWLQMTSLAQDSMSGIFRLNFCTGGRSGDTASIFIYSQWSVWINIRHLESFIHILHEALPIQENA